MKRAGKRMLVIIFLCVLLTSLLPFSASANAAEPPSLVILVHNPPEEVPVFFIEMIAMPQLIKEHTKRRAVLFAFLANTASLSAGSLLITVLPV